MSSCRSLAEVYLRLVFPILARLNIVAFVMTIESAKQVDISLADTEKLSRIWLSSLKAAILSKVDWPKSQQPAESYHYREIYFFLKKKRDLGPSWIEHETLR